ncbi:MAG TPA: rhomboid family intramembrane serine protease [Mobilitalea sp.]|nr:rhomboid family intramembrane serine protease [Mobilitalea sp.]
MSIIDGLDYQLVMREFKRAAIHASGFQLFYRTAANEEADIVIIFYAPSGDERTAEEYDQILSNIKKTFISSGFGIINLLGIILTEVPLRARQFCLEQDAHWIIDLSERRLIIYENQPSDFLGLRNEIELLLENEQYATSMSVDASEHKVDYGVETSEKPLKGGWITMFNTAMVAINIIVFIIIHYGIFGDTDPLLEGGALNWKFIMEEGEGYRIVTSMFLHSDFGHLINNMIVLFFVGDNLERAAGRTKYLIIYFGSGIIAGLTSISYNMIKGNNVLSVGASGAIFGIVGAIAYIIAVNKGRLEDINARQIILFTLFSLYGGIMSVNTDNAAHVGGFLGGVVLALLLYRKPKRT